MAEQKLIDFNVNEPLGIKTFDLLKVYKDPAYDSGYIAIQGIELDIDPGSLISIIGPSGAGKSTLLNLIGGLFPPTAGEILVGDIPVHWLTNHQLDLYRRKITGFLWQQPEKNLIYGMNAQENIELAHRVTGYPKKQSKDRIFELLSAVGLENRRYHKPYQLSGGESQRLSLAVALANEPKILLADEPTGELDSETTFEIINYLKELNKNFGTTIVVVTHDQRFTKMTSKSYQILDGQINLIKKAIQNEEVKHWEDSKQEELLYVDQYGSVRIPEELRQKLKIGRYLKIKIEENGRAYLETEDLQ
jgi:ABC-type lipoprotein export system ATPase subunit